MKFLVLVLAFLGSAVAFQPSVRLAAPISMSLKADDSKYAVAAAALAVLLSGSAPALAGDVDAGGLIFSANCAACHAGGNNVIAAEKTLKKDALVSYLSGGFKPESVVYQVTNGKNAMPAFGGRLSDEEIEDVAAYVFDQASGDKWE
eukprot:CAMPEP_0185744454 /NCGR_PEP_ID=MMETSP1174-20130828/2579_1 /TAXON_ID=35687 /ORGANISM="Dictyocha speculum, Strain CCMP1381" /LENGTH=146 /DNA_ID=CAMNT_0028417869 /DNA_START=40 /DNA_END=480 /DNA_ORIENTATION=-